jgi:hypothetical protein
VAGVVALALAVGTSCGTDTVEVPGTEVEGSAREACTRLVESLPDRVADQGRRETTGNPLGAAWGDPPIVLRCGVGTPEGYDRFAACQTVNGLDWFVPDETSDDQDLDVVMTTVGREPAVEVVLPATYRPPVAAMVDLGRVIEQHTELVRRCR